MSDLSPGNTESTDIVLEEGEEGYEAKVDALASEVGALKAKVCVCIHPGMSLDVDCFIVHLLLKGGEQRQIGNFEWIPIVSILDFYTPDSDP